VASNLEIVFSDWLDALRRGDIDRIASRLAPDVVHQGVRAELSCTGRDAVVARLRRRAAAPPAVTALELIEVGDQVVLSVRAPDVGVPAEIERTELRGQATVLFTLRDGLIVRMQDYASREAALGAAGAPAGPIWD
jgi:hypothetical protein